MTQTSQLPPPTEGSAHQESVVRQLVHGGLILLAVYVLFHLLWEVRALVLTAFLGILFAVAVSAGTDKLQKLRIPRGLGSPLIVIGFIGLLGLFGTWIGPTVRTQTIELRTKLPEALDKLERWIEAQGGGAIATVLGIEPEIPADTVRLGTTIVVAPAPTAAEEASPARETLRERLIRQLSGARRFFLPVLSSTVAVFAGIFLVIFLAIYIAVDPGLYKRGILQLVPQRSAPRVERTLAAIAATLRRWLTTQLIAMVVIGVVSTMVLLALRVRAAVPLGILAGLLEFVPTIGPILSALPAIAMGFVDSPEKALFVTLAYVGIQFVENHLLIPVLMKEGLDLPPAITIVAQVLMALVFGFLGLLVAVPLLAVVMIAIRVNRGDTVPGASAAPDKAAAS